MKSVAVETIDLTGSDDDDVGDNGGYEDESCSTSTDDYTVNCYSPSVSSKLSYTGLLMHMLAACYVCVMDTDKGIEKELNRQHTLTR